MYYIKIFIWRFVYYYVVLYFIQSLILGDIEFILFDMHCSLLLQKQTT